MASNSYLSWLVEVCSMPPQDFGGFAPTAWARPSGWDNRHHLGTLPAYDALRDRYCKWARHSLLFNAEYSSSPPQSVDHCSVIFGASKAVLVSRTTPKQIYSQTLPSNGVLAGVLFEQCSKRSLIQKRRLVGASVKQILAQPPHHHNDSNSAGRIIWTLI